MGLDSRNLHNAETHKELWAFPKLSSEIRRNPWWYAAGPTPEGEVMSKNENEIGSQARAMMSADAPQRPPLSFGPDREAFLIAKALHVASKAIFDTKHPAYSDAHEMREILMMRYHHHWNDLQFQDDLRDAHALGYRCPEGGCTAADLSAWLAKHPSRKN